MTMQQQQKLTRRVGRLEQLLTGYKHAKSVQYALLQLSELASSVTDMSVFYGAMHGVIGQLLQNALSFCPEGNEKLELSSSIIFAVDNQELCLIKISDNGPGIEPGEVQKIFEPFFTTRADGTGLGLAIANQVIETHNGSIAVEKSEMGGACFTLILPQESEAVD